jgi:hypothetical protein
MKLFQEDLLNKILLLLQIFVAQQTLIEKYIKQKNFFQLFINVEFEILLERKTFLFMIILCLSTYFPLSFISLFLHLKKLIINLNVISILFLSPLYLHFKIFYLEI